MPGEPYPEIRTWAIGSSTLSATLNAVREPGQRGLEAGVFWIGRREASATVQAVVIPTGPGVVEARGFWRVEPEVFGTITTWASERAWSLLAICHIHGHHVPARLSQQDRSHLVRAPGVLAIVIGESGEDEDPAEWGWYVFQDGHYREFDQTERARRMRIGGPGDAQVWTANRDGCQQVVT